jgi:hypothetical protein
MNNNDNQYPIIVRAKDYFKINFISTLFIVLLMGLWISYIGMSFTLNISQRILIGFLFMVLTIMVGFPLFFLGFERRAIQFYPDYFIPSSIFPPYWLIQRKRIQYSDIYKINYSEKVMQIILRDTKQLFLSKEDFHENIIDVMLQVIRKKENEDPQKCKIKIVPNTEPQSIVRIRDEIGHIDN